MSSKNTQFFGAERSRAGLAGGGGFEPPLMDPELPVREIQGTSRDKTESFAGRLLRSSLDSRDSLGHPRKKGAIGWQMLPNVTQGMRLDYKSIGGSCQNFS